jgi:hypothetical protein
VGEYGLRNKRELWRVQAALSKIRKAARTLLTLDDKVSGRCACVSCCDCLCCKTGATRHI